MEAPPLGQSWVKRKKKRKNIKTSGHTPYPRYSQESFYWNTCLQSYGEDIDASEAKIGTGQTMMLSGFRQTCGVWL